MGLFQGSLYCQLFVFTTQTPTSGGHVILKLVAPVAHLLFPGGLFGLSLPLLFRLNLAEVDCIVVEGRHHLPRFCLVVGGAEQLR